MESEPTTLSYARRSVQSPFSWWTAGGCALAGLVFGPSAIFVTAKIGSVGVIAAIFVAVLIGIALGFRNPTVRDLFQYVGILGLAASVPILVYFELSLRPGDGTNELARAMITTFCGFAGVGLAVVAFVAGMAVRRG